MAHTLPWDRTREIQEEKAAQEARKGQDPAFPVRDYSGLTRREYIATAAMQAILQHREGFDNPTKCAAWAVEQADELLAVLDANPPESA